MRLGAVLKGLVKELKMKAEITSIEQVSNERVKVTALVYWRGLPRPNYQANETDEEYAKRVEPIAKELESYNNLHLGWAQLSQEVEKGAIPKVEEYDT